jgi:uncharacterized paraquat-inducible protein A
MADIIPFKKSKSGPVTNKYGKLEGWATCQQCRHKWYASEVPTGKTEIQCPKCHTAKGLFMYGHEDSESIWICNCGCHVFTISETGAICWRCGVKQEF